MGDKGRKNVKKPKKDRTKEAPVSNPEKKK